MTESVAANDNTTHFPIRTIRIRSSIQTQILSHLSSWLPFEGCGLLGGHQAGPGVLMAEEFYPGTNVLNSPTRFRMADHEVIRAIVLMRESGQELVGIVHSHPSGPLTLSPTDLNEAFYRDIALLVVGFEMETPTIRGWSIAPGEQARPHDVSIDVFNSH